MSLLLLFSGDGGPVVEPTTPTLTPKVCDDLTLTATTCSSVVVTAVTTGSLTLTPKD